MKDITNHPKDRHVVAAAIRGRATIIVTRNLKDFPGSALDKYDIAAQHPDAFLLNLLNQDEARMLSILVQQAGDLRKSDDPVQTMLRGLSFDAPKFVQEVSRPFPGLTSRPFEMSRQSHQLAKAARVNVYAKQVA